MMFLEDDVSRRVDRLYNIIKHRFIMLFSNKAAIFI